MKSKISSFLVLFLIIVAAVSCSSESARYNDNVTQLRKKVRESFSPRFDPIWVAREKKAEKGKKEIDRLIMVMDEALKDLELYDPPQEMVPLHNIHKTLFVDCRSALLKINNIIFKLK